MAETCGIAELAREFGITTRTIRFYEDRGLITPRREGQRRVYASRDRVRLRLIMRGKRLGFSLEEIRSMIDIYDVDRTERTQLRLVLDKIVEPLQPLCGVGRRLGVNGCAQSEHQCQKKGNAELHDFSPRRFTCAAWGRSCGSWSSGPWSSG